MKADKYGQRLRVGDNVCWSTKKDMRCGQITAFSPFGYPKILEINPHTRTFAKQSVVVKSHNIIKIRVLLSDAV